MINQEMKQEEFEQRRIAQIKALEATIEKPVVKIIEAVEALLEQDAGEPVIVQYGNHRLLVTSIRTDADGRVRLCI